MIDAPLRTGAITLRRDGAMASDAAALPRGSSGASTRRAVGYGLIGVGAATLVVAGVFFGLNANLGSETTHATPASAEPCASWARFQASENAGREREADAEADTEADGAVRRDPVAGARRRGRDAQPGVVRGESP